MHPKRTENVTPQLQEYVVREIIPRYAAFDGAHSVEHVQTVIGQSLALAKFYPSLDVDMVYTAAAYHDTGLVAGRERHHIVSGEILASDAMLRQWFSPSSIETMRQAVEDHRASSRNAPRSLYGRILAEADRVIDVETIIRRTVVFGLEHYPSLSAEEHWERCRSHLRRKYGREGYMRLWIPESDNAARLEELRRVIDDDKELRQHFEKEFKI